MIWHDPPLNVFHGTDSFSAAAIATPSGGREHSIDLRRSKANLDFGRGFYVTTVEQQARDWADMRLEKVMFQAGAMPAVIRFEVNRRDMARLDDLVFSNPAGDKHFWSLVEHCRSGLAEHGHGGTYAIVTGPVTLWPQFQLMRDCDQISFHTDTALDLLKSPTILYPRKARFRDERR